MTGRCHVSVGDAQQRGVFVAETLAVFVDAHKGISAASAPAHDGVNHGSRRAFLHAATHPIGHVHMIACVGAFRRIYAIGRLLKHGRPSARSRWRKPGHVRNRPRAGCEPLGTDAAAAQSNTRAQLSPVAPVRKHLTAAVRSYETARVQVRRDTASLQKRLG